MNFSHVVELVETPACGAGAVYRLLVRVQPWLLFWARAGSEDRPQGFTSTVVRFTACGCKSRRAHDFNRVEKLVASRAYKARAVYGIWVRPPSRLFIFGRGPSGIGMDASNIRWVNPMSSTLITST